MKAFVCGASAVAFTTVSTFSLAGDFQSLNGPAVEQAVSGRTLRLETPVGSIPINFRTDGTMVGRTSDMSSWLGRSFDQGTWWVARDQLCQKWKLWLEGRSYCFSLRQSGSQVHWTRNDGLQGMLTVVNQ